MRILRGGRGSRTTEARGLYRLCLRIAGRKGGREGAREGGRVRERVGEREGEREGKGRVGRSVGERVGERVERGRVGERVERGRVGEREGWWEGRRVGGSGESVGERAGEREGEREERIQSPGRLLEATCMCCVITLGKTFRSSNDTFRDNPSP